mmetsp:Transcript_6876/g.27644  ORF Transcript_6876/g.27644 Transcript_6876/m.27644 type:complete len:290 (-) Transcript_6876:762-1631(-)
MAEPAVCANDACMGRPNANNRVGSPSWLLMTRPNAVADTEDANDVRCSVIHRSAPPRSWYLKLHEMPRKAPMPRAEVLRSGTGIAGSHCSPFLFLCKANNPELMAENAPPVNTPTADNSAALVTTLNPRVALVYWRKGPARSNALFGMVAMNFWKPFVADDPKDRTGVQHQTVKAFARDNCMMLLSARSHSDFKRSPRWATSYIVAAPIVTTCSNASLYKNAGSAMRRPTKARENACGVPRETARTTLGRTLTLMKRTRAREDTMPISTAMRIPPGSDSMVLNHSDKTA